MSDKILGLNAELRLSDSLDHIDNRFLTDNGGGGGVDDDYKYYYLCQVINMHVIIPTVIHRALALMYLWGYWGLEIK